MSEKLTITGITLIGEQAAKVRYRRTTTVKSGYSNYEYESHTNGHITSSQFMEFINCDEIRDIIAERLKDDFNSDDNTEEDDAE